MAYGFMDLEQPKVSLTDESSLSNLYGQRAQYAVNASPVDYSTGTYYGGQGLPDTSYEGQQAVNAPSAIGTGLSLVSKVAPYLGVAGLFVSGISSYFSYQQAKQQAQERKQQWLEEMALNKDKLNEDKRQFDKTLNFKEKEYRNTLNQAYAKKMQYMIESNPVLREKIMQLRTYRLSSNPMPPQVG